MSPLTLRFDNSFARDLPDFAVPWQPAQAPEPSLVFVNRALGGELGIPEASWQHPDAAAWWSGRVLPEGAQPVAQAYAGHQFGGFSPQLGDGRALLIGEVINTLGQRRDLAFKGSGRTPFSRGGDGKAAVGPMLREAVMGEAMHALGIPTTRALAVAATGESIFREQALPGAVLTRVASSHLRVGTFQYFAARNEHERVRQLADYAIARHDPDLLQADNRYLQLLQRVSDRQARLIAQWMGVGFIHGVMNTDNMTISGETIDYGPCAFMEAFDPRATFSSIDRQGRYAYGNQPGIARWNLARLAETLLPHIHSDSDQAVQQATDVIERFAPAFQAAWLSTFRAKLGLAAPTGETADNAASTDAADTALIEALLALLHTQTVDFTLGFRRLADALERPAAWLDLFAEPEAAKAWLGQWRARLSPQPGDTSATAARLRQVNPLVIPRNHLVEEALEAASQDARLEPFETLLAAVRHPFADNAEDGPFADPAPRDVAERHRTFCGT
ncbi:MAG: protein adenylyltransferase SelO [Rubrivivax sp.]